MKKDADHKLKFIELASKAASMLAVANTSELFDLAINDCLSNLAEFFAADRAYMFEFSNDLNCITNTHNWIKPDLTLPNMALQTFKTEDVNWWKKELLDKKQIYIKNIDQLPPEAFNELKLFKQLKMVSLVDELIFGNKGRITGFIGFASMTKTMEWSSADLLMMETLGNILGAAIDNQKYSKKIIRQNEFTNLILSLSSKFIHLPLEEIDKETNIALKKIGSFFHADRAYIFDYNLTEQTSSNTYEWCRQGITSEKNNLQNLPLEHVREWHDVHLKGKPLVIKQIKELPESKLKKILEPQGITSLINVPLMDYGTCLGYVGLDIVNANEASLGEDELAFLTLFADLLVNLERRKRAEAPLKLSATVFDHANEGIMITDVSGKILKVNDAFSRITGYDSKEVIGKDPSILSSGSQDEKYYKQMWTSLQKTLSWSGEIWNRRKTGEVYAEMQTVSAVTNASGKITHYVSLFSDISAQKAHQQALEHIANYDALTNLPNRVLLKDRMLQAMTQAQRRGELIAVIYLDLDGFKEINDRHGHKVGDQLLIQISKSMQEALRSSDTLARLGGDEFIVILADLPNSETSHPLINRLLEAASTPLLIDNKILKVTASLGVTYYPQQESIDADQLLLQSDLAMYKSKQLGKNQFHLFDIKKDQDQRGRTNRLFRLEKALTNNEFILYFQPKVNLITKNLIGFEALIRWQHPEKGLLMPSSFLPELAHHEIMIRLGDWALHKALKQLDIWIIENHQDLCMSINLDPLQMLKHDFAESIESAISAYPNIGPENVELEILETTAIEDIEHISKLLHDCKKLGIKLALDDFGTGFSSLSYLKRLPVDTIKIDRSFVRDMITDEDDRNILQGIIELAKTFNRKVIAEGIENQQQADLLVEMGCVLGQGFFIGKPMPADSVNDWIKHNKVIW